MLVAAAGWQAAPSTSVLSDLTPTMADGVPAVFGLAMVFVLLTYGGWNEVAYVSAEVKGGPRAIVRALVVSLAVITCAYLVFVLGALRHRLVQCAALIAPYTLGGAVRICS